jgi:group I intron endonuclease
MYVGSTTNFTNRKSRHLNDLNKGKHHSKKLQRSWSKYGADNFIFVILEDNVENLIEREQYWIDFLDSYENGFNSRPDAQPVLFGEKHHCYNKSPANKGAVSKNRKKIISYDLTSGEVKYYDFSSQPIKEEGFHPQYTSTFKEFSKSQGRLWFLQEDFYFEFFKEKYLNVVYRKNKTLGLERSQAVKNKISSSKMGKKFSKEHKVNLSKSKIDKGRSIQRSDGKIYQSIAGAARDLNVDPSIISRSLSLERKASVNGYFFKYNDQ